MNASYPETLILETNDFVEEFKVTVKHLELNPKDVTEIVSGIVICMLDDFHRFPFILSRLPDFSRLYQNPHLQRKAAREELAVATHRLGCLIYDRCKSIGAFVPHLTQGGLGYFPYYLRKMITNDAVLTFIADDIPSG